MIRMDMKIFCQAKIMDLLGNKKQVKGAFNGTIVEIGSLFYCNINSY